VTPKDAGLGVDVDATIDKYTGLSWNPSIIWNRLTGSEDGDAVTTVNQTKLKAAVKAAADNMNTDPTEGAVTFTDAKATLKEPTNGVKLDTDATAKALEDRWLNSDGSMAVTATTAKPKVSADEWKNFMDSTAQPLVSDAVTVDDGSNKAQLTTEQLASAATVKVADGKPTLKLDGSVLLKDVVTSNPKMKSSGRDATFKLTGKAGHSKPQIVPAKEGRGIKESDLVSAVTKAATGDDRTAKVKLTTTQPTVSTATAKKWKLQVVAQYATPFPAYDTVRNKNLKAGSARVNGTVVEPGKEFNLANQFGPVTTENGYFVSGVVMDGLSSQAVGGGLSQIATMSYNAGYLSGMQDIQHQAHTRWFDRYPAGRESTYWEGEINVRWKNDTPAPVAVEMWVGSDDKVHMRVWGVKYWKVTTHSSDHYNITDPQTVHSSGSKCEPENTGIKGFTIDVTRTRQAPGKPAEKKTQTTTYQAWPHVICN
jgi:vancomycin resistance protein YoaR